MVVWRERVCVVCLGSGGGGGDDETAEGPPRVAFLEWVGGGGIARVGLAAWHFVAVCMP